MFKTPSYSEVGQAGDDLLSEGFPSNRSVQINFKRTGPEGFKLKSSIKRKFQDNSKECLSVAFLPSLTYSDYKFESKLKSKAGRKDVSLKIDNLFDILAGSELKIGASDNLNRCFASVGYSNEQVNLRLKMVASRDEEKKKTETVYKCSGVVNYPKEVYWGLKGTFDFSQKKGLPLTNLNGKIHFDSPNTTIFFDNILNKHQQLGLLWSQKISNTVRVVSKYTTSTDLATAPTLETVIETDCEHGTFKSKASVLQQEKPDLKLQFAYSSNFTDRASYTLGAALNASELLGGASHGVSLGFEVNLK